MFRVAALVLSATLAAPEESGERPAWLDDVEDWGDPADAPEPESGDEKPEPTRPKEVDRPAWLDDVEGWDDPDEHEPSTASATSTDPPPRARPEITAGEPERTDAVTGALRLVGAFLHYPAAVEDLGLDDDGLVALVGRIIVTDELADDVTFELNMFADISRAPVSLGGTFATAGSFTTPYRNPALTVDLWRDGAIVGVTGIDRAKVGFKTRRGSVDLGRFPVNYAVTQIFTPNDFFAPFSPTAINRAFKPGVDAVRGSTALGRRGALEAVAVMGFDGVSQPSWAQTALLVRPSVVLWEFEWSALGGKVAERWIAGGALQGDAGPVGLRAEGHVGIPDRDGNGRDDEAPHVRVAAGPNINFAWRSTTLAAEYGYYGSGGNEPAAYLAALADRFPDDLPYLGQHYVGLTGGLEATPLLRVQGVGLLNAADASGNAGLFLNYSVTDEADLIAGGYVPWGRRPTVDATGLGLRSEYGAAPLTIFVESRIFF